MPTEEDNKPQTGQTSSNSQTTTSPIDDNKVREIEPGVFVRRPKGSKYIIEYRRDVCIGAASCSAIAPATFSMDNENKAVLLGSDSVNETGAIGDIVDDDEIILAAAQSCPVFAIIIKDAETGAQIFPVLEDED